MVKKVSIEVDQMGNAKIEAEGYEGGTCIDATAAFEGMMQKVEKERQAVGDCDNRKDDGERINI